VQELNRVEGKRPRRRSSGHRVLESNSADILALSGLLDAADIDVFAPGNVFVLTVVLLAESPS
jgi:hypothetical protein